MFFIYESPAMFFKRVLAISAPTQSLQLYYTATCHTMPLFVFSPQLCCRARWEQPTINFIWQQCFKKNFRGVRSGGQVFKFRTEAHKVLGRRTDKLIGKQRNYIPLLEFANVFGCCAWAYAVLFPVSALTGLLYKIKQVDIAITGLSLKEELVHGVNNHMELE